jgi:hypothetical protein
MMFRSDPLLVDETRKGRLWATVFNSLALAVSLATLVVVLVR